MHLGLQSSQLHREREREKWNALVRIWKEITSNSKRQICLPMSGCKALTLGATLELFWSGPLLFHYIPSYHLNLIKIWTACSAAVLFMACLWDCVPLEPLRVNGILENSKLEKRIDAFTAMRHVFIYRQLTLLLFWVFQHHTLRKGRLKIDFTSS